jgi:hypothetical protein
MECRHWDGDRSNNNDWNLVYGTRLDNAEDRERHGRTVRGERSTSARISDDDVAKIKEIYAAKEANQYELAARFSISQAQVNNIILGKQRTGSPRGCIF